MSGIIKAWLLLTRYPDLFIRRLIFGLKALFPLPRHPVYKRITGIMFEFDFSYDPAIRDMFLGKYEKREINMLKNILRPGDVFIDVGANIGYFSAVAAGLVGETGAVHSFEPVPEYFQRLQNLARMNPAYKIITNQCALGEREETARIDITCFSNIGWNTMVTSFMKPAERKQTITVPVRRFDNYIKEHNLNNIALIKIDVEGYEFPVLKGSRDFLGTARNRPPILCEINPAACPLMGYHLKDLFDYMKGFGYSAFDLNNKRLNWSNIKELSNVLFRQ